MPPKSSTNDSTGCKTCNLTFKNYDAYHKHKVSSARHITCGKCSMDFRTDAALKSHHDLQHPAEQQLPCPGCNKVFVRLGSLMSHIESGECSPVDRAKIEAVRKMKESWNINARAAHRNKDFSRTGGTFGEQPNPFAVPMNSTSISTKPAAIISKNAAAFAIGEDLIKLDEMASILNSPWNDSVFNPMSQSLNQATTYTTAASTTESFQNPNVKTAVLDEAWDEHDPEGPNFKASNYYFNVLRKYKCPNYPCNKSFIHQGTFIAHLKSPAHREEKLQCNNCLRYFLSATALTQHCEAQGTRCKVRETDGYGGLVDEVTGGTARTEGRHVDNTVRYAVNGNFGANTVVAAHKAAAEARTKKFDDYWSSEKLDNHRW